MAPRGRSRATRESVEVIDDIDADVSSPPRQRRRMDNQTSFAVQERLIAPTNENVENPAPELFTDEDFAEAVEAEREFERRRAQMLEDEAMARQMQSAGATPVASAVQALEEPSWFVDDEVLSDGDQESSDSEREPSPEPVHRLRSRTIQAPRTRSNSLDTTSLNTTSRSSRSPQLAFRGGSRQMAIRGGGRQTAFRGGRSNAEVRPANDNPSPTGFLGSDDEVEDERPNPSARRQTARRGRSFAVRGGRGANITRFEVPLPQSPTDFIDTINWNDFIVHTFIDTNREFPNGPPNAQNTSAPPVTIRISKKKTVPFDGSYCPICFEDPPTDPIACKFCEKCVGCMTCVQKWVTPTGDTNRRSCILCRKAWGAKPELLQMSVSNLLQS
ncbi:hypothetical protein M3Y94_00709000 [Aphelenchoides besseyi]|nr:hypothetical protein M3Y94_00709000 [Aphelenchoides besseyi]KAI6231687.1 hypothetical protein M3Y95_00408000 [Aphelenchoides besseyi]